MLIPQFTTRYLFGLIAACAVLFFVASLAVNGHYIWAIALIVGVGSIALLFGVFALVFWCAWVMASIFRTRDDSQNSAGSPFAEDRPAPQILPPNVAP